MMMMMIIIIIIIIIIFKWLIIRTTERVTKTCAMSKPSYYLKVIAPPLWDYVRDVF